jgi:hypothetical protein
VPAESARFTWRLSRRDWWFMGVIAVVAVVITLASIAFTGGNGQPGAEKGCFSLERASIMGAATTTYCGATAVEFCRTAPAGDREIAEKCDALERLKAS